MQEAEQYRPQKIKLNEPCNIFFEKYEQLREYGYGSGNGELLVSKKKIFEKDFLNCEKTLYYNDFFDKKIREPIIFHY